MTPACARLALMCIALAVLATVLGAQPGPESDNSAPAPDADAQDNPAPSSDTSHVSHTSHTSLSSSPSSASAPKQAPQLPWELRPYDVRIDLAFSQAPVLTDRFRSDVAEALRKACDRTYGQMWRVTVGQADWLIPPTRERLERAVPDSIPKSLPTPDQRTAGVDRLVPGSESPQQKAATPAAKDADKAFVITIETEGSQYRISGREWDRLTGTLGPLVTQTVFVRNTLAVEVLRLVKRAFRPVLSLETTETETVTVRLRAGELVPNDSPDAALHHGKLFQPFFRYLDRENRVRGVQLLPWTYLRVDGVQRSRASCTLLSGLRSPLGTGRRRRVEALAIALEPHFSETRLTLVNQRNQAQPLVGYQVFVLNQLPPPASAAQGQSSAQSPPPAQNAEQPATASGKPPHEDSAKPAEKDTDRPLDKDSEKPLASETDQPPAGEPDKPLSMLSDRNGAVAIPVDAEHPVRWIYVRSGESVLARVPIVPGAERTKSLAVPDDSLELQVQGQLARLQAQLIDVVARRAVLTTLLQRFGQAGKWEQVDKILAEVKTLPPPQHFESQLEAIRFPAVKTAQEQGLRLAESRIEKACRDTKELIQHHLDETKLRDVKTEVEELRKLDASDKSAKPGPK